MSETAQSESRSEDSAAGKTDGEIKAIAAETEIAAIEEGGKQALAKSAIPLTVVCVNRSHLRHRHAY